MKKSVHAAWQNWQHDRQNQSYIRPGWVNPGRPPSSQVPVDLARRARSGVVEVATAAKPQVAPGRPRSTHSKPPLLKHAALERPISGLAGRGFWSLWRPRINFPNYAPDRHSMRKKSALRAQPQAQWAIARSRGRPRSTCAVGAGRGRDLRLRRRSRSRAGRLREELQVAGRRDLADFLGRM